MAAVFPVTMIGWKMNGVVCVPMFRVCGEALRSSVSTTTLSEARKIRIRPAGPTTGARSKVIRNGVSTFTPVALLAGERDVATIVDGIANTAVALETAPMEFTMRAP